MSTKLVLALLGTLLVGFTSGALIVNAEGYQTLQTTVQQGVREMRARAVAGDEIALRAFSALSAYIHADPIPESVFFAKGMHIYDEGFWTP
jgi:hypothetical protein